MPPSPKSQQGFSSPHGSPGPHSISPQDLNPFSCNNYETMQKKFDLFNLDATTHPSYNSYNSPQKIAKNINNGANNSGISQISCNINTTENTNNDNNQPKITHGSNLVENLNFGKQHLNSKQHQLMQHSNINR